MTKPIAFIGASDQKYVGLVFRNEGQKIVEIDIEGTIGGSFWQDDSPESKNTKEKMKAELKELSNLKAETIVVNINSYGGDVNHGLSIHDLLAENSAKIITKINGMTASAATIIAMAGDERHMSDNSLFLAHHAMTLGWGNINDINSAADDLKKVDDRILNIYVKVTGQTKEVISEVFDRRNGHGEWITADEAKEKGFITNIFEPKKMAAFFSNDILNQFNLPSIPKNLMIQSSAEETEPSWLSKIFNRLDKLSPHVASTITNSNTINMNKDFGFINKVLNVEGLESNDGKNFNLSIESITAINNELAKLAAANADVEKHKGEAEKAKNELTTAINKIDEIDATVKTAEGIEAKVTAITKKLAEKPGHQAAENLGDDDKGDKSGADFETINNLPHNREVDENM